METNKPKEKEFDAVKMMRDIREKIFAETEGITFEQLRDYINEKLKGRKRVVGQK
jgi:hypothetical protein